jgi:hypothetical protein
VLVLAKPTFKPVSRLIGMYNIVMQMSQNVNPYLCETPMPTGAVHS